MEFTVIIPAYNSEDVIERCLTSLIEQEGVTLGKEYEIIVIDDGSRDATVEKARTFPVTVIPLGENKGRIIARVTGAQNAKTPRILFVDTRITVAPDFLSHVRDLSDKPALIGELHRKENKYKTLFDTVFYLIRRRYYGPRYFPLQDDELVITEENIKRAPKGTAILLIDRDLFIKLTPERTDRNVNDDTLLFHNLIKREGIPLVRTKKLFFEYSQRTDMKQFTPWLFDRGTRFADFYFRPGGYLFIPFLLTVVFALAVIAGAVVAAVYAPGLLAYIGGAVLVLYVALCVWLSENPRDFITLFAMLPLILAIFGAGVVKFLFLQLTKPKQRGK